MKGVTRYLVLVTTIVVLVPFAMAGEGQRVKKSPLDHVVLYESLISKDSPIRIREFPTENADLGTGANEDKPKYYALAREMQEKASDLTLQAVIAGLREHGFHDVALVEGNAAIPDDALVIEGEFTKLDPGSEGKRYMVGFGAGKSKVCASGKVVRGEQGKVLMEFDHCRYGSAGALGGNSEAMMTKDSKATGSHLARFMGQWADGKYVR